MRMRWPLSLAWLDTGTSVLRASSHFPAPARLWATALRSASSSGWVLNSNCMYAIDKVSDSRWRDSALSRCWLGNRPTNAATSPASAVSEVKGRTSPA